KSPYFVTCDCPDLQVLCISSAAVDSPDEQMHRGHSDQDALELISEELNLWPEDTRPRIAVLDHHAIVQDEPKAQYPDYSNVDNGESLLPILFDRDIDMVLHGHKHFPLFKTYSQNNSSQIALLGAGSFSHKMPTHWEGIVANGIHVINFES